MALTLALVEGVSLFVAVGAMILLWLHPLLTDWTDVLTFLSQAIGISLCCLVAFYYNDLYDLRIVRSLSGFASRLLQAFGVTFILLAVFYSIFPDTAIARGPFVSSLVIIVGLLLPLRALTYWVMRRHPFVERVLVLGASPLARRIVAEIESQPQFGYAVVGVVDNTAAPAPIDHAALASLGRIGKIVEDVRPDRIVVALAERRGNLPVAALVEARMRGVTVEDGITVYERLTKKIAIESLTPGNLIFSSDFRNSKFEVAIGRAISLLASVVGLVAFAPLFGLIALAIKLDSRGSVLFVHERIGLHGRRFRLLKFRTMRCVEGNTSEWVRDNGDRITRVGQWLRKYRLDELPQFVNILRGQMNLVGPRPHPVSNLALFTERIPCYSLRLGVRPGVTGWAQIRYGYANGLDEEIEKMRYDLYYIKHLSFWFDLRILVDTVKIVLFGRGATAADAYPNAATLGVRR